MTRRALITGIGGQDGSYLAELLLEQGYDVFGVVRRPPAAYAAALAGVLDRVELVEADLLDRDSLVRALDETQPTEVYNLAAPSFVPRSWDEPVLTAEFAAVGVTSLLEAVREVDPSIRVYQASSSEIFGEPRESPQDEETPLNPLTPYGVAKAYGHFIAASYRRRYGMFTSCGILYNHESPRRPVDFLPRKVARAAAAISLGLEQELVLGDLDARRDWGYAKDYVRAMWLDAAAGPAGRLRRRDRRQPLRAGAGRAGVRPRRARLARARPLGSGTPPRRRRAARPRRRRRAGAAGARLGAERDVRGARRGCSSTPRSQALCGRSGGVQLRVDVVVGARRRFPGEGGCALEAAAGATRPGARARPRRRRRSPPPSCGLNSRAASPQTSGSEVTFEAATGQPHAIASSGGWPKPS